MSDRQRPQRDTVTNLLDRLDGAPVGSPPADTVPSGFPSLDRALGGGFRSQDLIALGGDVGSGKSALTLAITLRTAAAGHRVALLSGEMNQDRVLERAIAIEGRVSIDDLRSRNLTEEQRVAVGAAALRIRDLPIAVHPLIGGSFADVMALAWEEQPSLVVVDYLQVLPPPATRVTQDEESATAVRALKALALEHNVPLFVVAQLPRHRAQRPDPRPTFDDFGALGAVSQHADVVLGLYREAMYKPEGGIEGATELVVVKNRNGPTGFVDLYFYEEWIRFEDMLDPDR